MPRIEPKKGMMVRAVNNRHNSTIHDELESRSRFVKPGDILILNGSFYPEGPCYYTDPKNKSGSNYVGWDDFEVIPEWEATAPKARGPHKCECPPVNFFFNGIGCTCGGI